MSGTLANATPVTSTQTHFITAHFLYRPAGSYRITGTLQINNQNKVATEVRVAVRRDGAQGSVYSTTQPTQSEDIETLLLLDAAGTTGASAHISIDLSYGRGDQLFVGSKNGMVNFRYEGVAKAE